MASAEMDLSGLLNNVTMETPLTGMDAQLFVFLKLAGTVQIHMLQLEIQQHALLYVAMEET